MIYRIALEGNPEICGFCGLQPLDDLPGIEIGWWLAAHLWGRGLATEAARSVLEDAFGRGGLNRIVAVAKLENKASIRIMKKLGMRYERDAMHRGIEVVLYAIEK